MRSFGAAKRNVVSAALCLSALLCALVSVKSSADEISVDEIPVDEIPVDEIPVDKPADAGLAGAGSEPESTPTPLRVGEVSVTATRAERETLDTPGNVSVIDREQIDRSGAASIPDLLRRESGISVTNITTNPTFVTVEARGFNNGGSAGSSVLVLVDGIRVNEADSGIADWALIDMDAVARVEVVRGSASALYGDNAVGAVINIITRAEPGSPRFTARGAVGRYDTGHGSLAIAGTEGPVTVSLFGRGFTTDGYRDRANYDAGSGKGSLEVELGERVTVGVGGGYHTDDRKLPGTLFRSEIEEFGRRASRRAEDRSEIDRHNVRGWIEAILAEDVVLRVKPHYHDRDEDVVITFTGFEPTSIETDKDAVGVDAQVQVDLKLGPMKNRLIVGSEFLREETSRNITSDSPFSSPLYTRSRQYTYGAFLQDELNLTEELLLSAGIRFDHASYKLRAFDNENDVTDRPDFDIWSPKAALTYRVISPVSIYAAYARGFRLPNFDENTPLLPFLGFGDIDIPDLDEQRSDTFEGGVKYQGDKIHASVSGYHMRVKDELVGLFLDPFTFENVNFDRVIHNGVETSFRLQPIEWLTLYGSYTYEDVEIRKTKVQALGNVNALDNQRLPINPIHRGAVGILFNLPYWFEAGYNANIVGKRYLSNDFTHQASRLDSYATHDMHIALRPKFSDHVEGSISLAVRNITAEKYSEFGAVTFFGPAGEDPGPNGLFESFFPAPKRTWEVGFVLTVRR
jgi:iron complex outermembrane receptor protein